MTAWDEVAERYDWLYQTRWSELENAWVRERLRGFTGRVLDIGCGTGLGRELLPAEVEYTGVDISEGMLQAARKRHPGERFAFADACDLPFADATFDGAISLFGCLSYCVSPTRAVAEIVRVVKRGSPVFLMVLGRWSVGSILGGRWRGEGAYLTRGVELNGARCRFFGPTELRSFVPGGRVEGMGALAGVCERPALWPIDRALTRIAPGLAHNLAVVGVV